jgi:uncharacterized FlaG/YvyC family protein
MEVRFSEALPLEKTIRGNVLPGAAPPITVVPKRSDASQPTEAVKNPQAEGKNNSSPLSREMATELVKRSAELLSTFDRELKYEVKDDAGVVQIQVIDSRDGRVVRKIPADEVIRFLEHMKEQIDDRVDILA